MCSPSGLTETARWSPKRPQIRNLCKHIFEIGKLDKDKLAHAILLHAFSIDLRYIRDKHEDNEKSTPADIVQSLEKAKIRWEEETKDERANAARTTTKSPASTKGAATSGVTGVCATCNGKDRTDDCWAEGGAMEGRRDEVIERRPVGLLQLQL
jgi:hypothetical protein